MGEEGRILAGGEPENYGQMIVDGVSHFAGVKKYVHRIGPMYSQMLGNWLQGRITKK